MKYITALVVIVFGTLFFTTQTYAQDISPEALLQDIPSAKQIPTINPLLAQEARRHTHHAALCAKPNDPSIARCFGDIIVDETATPFTTSAPAGYGPAELRGAYSVTGKASSGTPIIAIVDAYDQPNMFSDLKTYSTTFNLPQLADCSGAINKATVPCFKKVNQTGGSTYPSTNTGWALEISLDVEAAHAMCDNCSILLVEAKSATNTNLLTAVDTAVNLGADVVSNSYGSSEVSGETTYDKHFNHPGIAIMASSGDSGYGVSYPAASRYVVAVGSTTLNLTSSGAYLSESAWSDGGSGCSKYETKPSWQQDTGCSKRTIADIAADADPVSGAAVYDSVRYNGQKGWFKIGGTSLSSPLVAGIFAASAQLSSATQAGSFLYGLTASHFNDITTGSNGSCSPIYLCKARTGYDRPTGLGSPNGAF